MFKSGPVFRQYSVVITANLSVLFVGLILAWPSPMLVKLRNQNQTILPLPITEGEGAWISSIPLLTGLSVLFVSSHLMDKIGRKWCIVLSCIPRMIMVVLYIFASEVWILLLGRAVGGIADILTITVVATYASEIASKEIRGGLGAISQIISAIGMLIMLSSGPFVSYMTLNIILAGIFALLTVPLLFLPETPYFLYSKGRTDDLLKALIFLRGTEALAREEMKEYSLQTDTKLKKIQFLRDRSVLKTLGKVLFFSMESQLVGFYAVSFYLQTIFESTQTSVSPQISSAVIGCIQLVACLCTILITDRFGRKPILTVSLIGMAIGMIGLGVFFKLAEDGDEITGFLNYLPLISLMLVIYCYSAGIGSLAWLLVAELFDGPSRAFGVSISVFTSTMFMFLVIKFFGTVTNAIGPALTYWIFSANCIIACLFIMFFLPETKGKTFAEIQQALGRQLIEKT